MPHRGWPIWRPQLLLYLYPCRIWILIWRLRSSTHWGWLPLWLLHTDLSNIPCRGNPPIWILLFSVALMTHRGWPPIWIPNTSIYTIYHTDWLQIWRPNLPGCLALLPNQMLTLLPLLPLPDSLIFKNLST